MTSPHMVQAEEDAGQTIDELVGVVSWQECSTQDANVITRRGVANRELWLKSSHNFVDYALCHKERLEAQYLTNCRVLPRVQFRKMRDGYAF